MIELGCAAYKFQLHLKRRSKMAYYLMLSSLTDEGAKTVKNKPERIKEVNAEVEAMGVKILSQYALVGPYDFVSILEAPDNEADNWRHAAAVINCRLEYCLLTAGPLWWCVPVGTKACSRWASATGWRFPSRTMPAPDGAAGNDQRPLLVQRLRLAVAPLGRIHQ